MKTSIRSAAGVLLLALAPALHAQAPADSALLPACAEGGISRLAMTVPPGQTPEQVTEALAASGVLAEGTQVKFLADHEKPAILNTGWFNDRWRMHMQRFLRQGLQVNGQESTLIEVDAEGRVTEVHADTGNRDVNRALRDLWRQARFEPVVVGSCRVPAWLHVGFEFQSDYRDGYRDVEMRPVP